MDLFGAAATADPHTVNAELRAEQPVVAITLPGGNPAYVISRYADAKRALADPRLVKTSSGVRMGGGPPMPPAIHDAVSLHMLNADGADHTRLRRLVSKGFTARRVADLRPSIEAISDALLADMAGKDEVDLLSAYAFPLPLQVICELLGVPMEDRDSFREWSNVVVTGAMAGGDVFTPLKSLVDYIAELIEARRAVPDDGLLSALVHATDDGDRLTPAELSSMVFLLLIAGHETTVNLIGNAMYLLLRNPADAAALRADPSLAPAAIEEYLRFESPVKTATVRIAAQDVDYAGTVIPAGSIVMVSLLAADHDSDAFPDADTLDIGRAPGQHLAFGHGIHYCLGAPLARMEGQIAIDALLAAFPDMTAAAPLDGLLWRPGVLLRGLVHLPVRLRR